MFSVLVIRLRSLRLLRVSGIDMRLRMFLLLITFLNASHSFRNLLLVICKNAFLYGSMTNRTLYTFPTRRSSDLDALPEPLEREQRNDGRRPGSGDDHRSARSEEHTSELQSPDHIVCRLLLE